MSNRQKNGLTVGAAIGLTAAGLLLVAAFFLWLWKLPDYRREAGATPTPTVRYGSIAAVTRDPALPSPAPVLGRGDKGSRVIELQMRLSALGYYAGEIDGDFGGGTERAVKAFQAANGLETDGYVGEATEALLYSTAAAAAQATPAPTDTPAAARTPAPTSTAAFQVLKSGSKGDSVRRVQERLLALGYYEGTIDGQYGPATKTAVYRFQNAHGLSTDSVVGQATWDRLFSADAMPAPTPTPTPRPDASASLPYVRPDGLPLVVNRQQPMPEGYRHADLVVMNSYCDSTVVKIKYADTQAERLAVDALMTMLRAAKADGVGNWQISAAYRSETYQQQLFDKKVKELMNSNGLSRSKATEAARREVADPGTSEHHLGTCFDITVPGTSFKGTKQHKWLAAHCWEYGFILRYPEGKTKITGFTAEAWHYRWVGQPHARIMHEEGLCLEEYVEKYGVEIEQE